MGNKIINFLCLLEQFREDVADVESHTGSNKMSVKFDNVRAQVSSIEKDLPIEISIKIKELEEKLLKIKAERDIFIKQISSPYP